MNVATIDLKIATAQAESQKLYKQRQTWQESVDNLLDRMNTLNKLLMSLQSILINLTFEIERDFSNFKQSELAPKGIGVITTTIAKVLVLVRKSDLYPGVKSTYYLLKQENNYLRELLVDRSTSIDIDKDKKMDKIIKATIKLINNKYKSR